MQSIMKKIMLLIGAVLVSTGSFAIPSKSSQQLKTLGSAWKSYHSIQPTLDKSDLEMGYGGQDISHSHPLVPVSSFA